MGYATNRYFQPAKYTPIVSEVEMPFKELFAAGKIRQEYEDAAGATSIKTGEQGNILQMASTSDGQVLRNAHAENFAEQDASLQQDAYNFSKAIAGQEKSSPEMQAALQDIDSRYNAVYGPNGERAIHQQAAKDYQTLRKNISETPGVTEHPWDALEGDLSIINYATGKTNYVDPYAVNKNIHVNWNEAADKMLSGIKEIGEAWASPDGTYISHGSRTQITPAKIRASYRAGLHGSDLQNDMWRKREYNVRVKHMSEDMADKIYEDDVNAMEDYVVNMYTKKIETAGLSADVAGMRAADKQDEWNKRKPTEGYAVKSPNLKAGTGAIPPIGSNRTGPNVYDYLTEEEKYAKDGSLISTKDAMAKYQAALANSKQREVLTSKLSTSDRNSLRNSITDFNARNVVALGPNSTGTPMNGADFARSIGFKNYDDFKKYFAVNGIAKEDQFGLGAGTIIATVVVPTKVATGQRDRAGNPVYVERGNPMQIAISPDITQEKAYQASTHLASPVITGAKESYFIPGFDDDGTLNYSKGITVNSKAELDALVKKYNVSAYLKSNNYISNGSFQIENPEIYTFDKDAGTYSKRGNISLDEIREAEDKSYIKNFNVPSGEENYQTNPVKHDWEYYNGLSQ